MMKHIEGALTVFFSLFSLMVLSADTYVWVGAANAKWTNCENWLVNGAVPKSAPVENSSLSFPNPAKVSDVPSNTVSTIFLGGDVELSYSGKFTVNGEISGPGSLKMIGSVNASSETYLNGDNTFSGGYVNWGGRTYVGHSHALGSGKAVFASNGLPGLPFYANATGLTITNAVEVGLERNWSGSMGGKEQCVTEFTGDFEFSNAIASGAVGDDPYHRINNGSFVFGGSVKHSGGTAGIVVGASLTFNCPMKGNAYPIFHNSFNNDVITFNATGNVFSSVNWANGDGTTRFGVDNALDGVVPVFFGNGTATSGRFILDLAGHNQLVESIHSKNNRDPASGRKVISEMPAVVTMKATDNHVFGGHFDGAVSVVWNPDGDYRYTVTNANSTTTGSLVIRRGAMTVGDGAKFSRISGIELAPGTRLAFEDGGEACSGSLRTLVLGKGAKLEIAGGKTLMVGALYTEDEQGVRTRLANGRTYDSEDLAELGAGILVQAETRFNEYIGKNDGSWNDALNWQYGAMPDADEIAVVPNGITNITVDGDAKLVNLVAPAGNALKLVGTGRLVLPKGETVISNDATLTIGCELAGAGKLISRGRGVLRLEHDNTYSGGTLRDLSQLSANGSSWAGGIEITDGNALGSGKAEFNSYSGLLVASDNLVVPNDISWQSEQASSPQFYLHLRAKGDATFTGKLDFSHTRCARTHSSGKIIYAGEVVLEETTSLTSWAHTLCVKDGIHEFTGKVSGKGGIMSDTPANWRFFGSHNDIRAVYFWNATTDNKLESFGDDNFVEGTKVMFVTGGSAKTQSWDLHGHSQTIDSAYDLSGSDASNHRHYIVSDSPATLTMKATGDRSYAGNYNGAMSVIWDPMDDYRLLLVGGNHGMSGRFSVKRGTVEMKDGAVFDRLGGVEVASGAKLVIGSGSRISTHMNRLLLGEDAVFDVADEMRILVDEYLTVNAAGITNRLPGGTEYQLGKVTVLVSQVSSSSISWTGYGSNDMFSTAANWTLSPAFDDGKNVAVFAMAGKHATVDAPADLKGIAFAGVEDFTIDGDCRLAIGKDGLLLDNAFASEAMRAGISAPIVLTESSSLLVPISSALNLGGCLSGGEEVVLTVKGAGTVDWNLAEGSSYAGTIVLSNNIDSVHGFGGMPGKIKMYDFPENSTHVSFYNAVVDGPIELFPEPVTHNNYGAYSFFVIPNGTTNVFNGPITIKGSNYVRFSCGSGSRCVFAGGLYQTGSFMPVPLGSGWYVVTNTPINVSYWWSDTPGSVIFATPGNVFTTGIRLGNENSYTESQARIEADNAIAHCPNLVLSSSSKFDLCGHDVGVGRLSTVSATGNASVHSDSPATLFVTNQNAEVSHFARFSGKASLVKAGSKALTLTGFSSTSGGIEVRSGELVIGEGASWHNASLAKIDNNATLTVGVHSPFGRLTKVVIENGAKLNLRIAKSACVVGGLQFGDIAQALGTYGATGSTDEAGNPPDHVDDSHFSGNGVLRVEEPCDYATWLGTGNDDRISNVDNWDCTPDFSDESYSATFSKFGNKAQVDADMRVHGCVFNQNDGFALTGSNTMSVGDGGIFVNDGCAVTIFAPLEVSGDMDWSIGAGATLAITGRLNGAGCATVMGTGSAEFHSNDGDFSGEMTIACNKVTVQGYGFGTNALGRLNIDATVYGHIYLTNSVIVQAVDIWENTDAAKAGQQIINSHIHTVNHFYGPVTLHNNTTYVCSYAYCDFVWHGGLFTKDMLNGGFALNGGGRHIITDTPADINLLICNGFGNVVLEVPGNRIGEIVVSDDNRNASSLRLAVDDAVVGCRAMRLKGGATVILDGHDLEVDQLFAETPGDVVKSDRPATLYAKQSGDGVVCASFIGKASYRKGGDGTVELNGVSSSSGSLTVDAGRLVCASNCRWSAASSAVIVGGVLELTHSEALGLETSVEFADAENGTLLLDAGVEQRVGKLVIGGQTMCDGTWGAIGNGRARFHSPRIAGDGVIKVGNIGAMMLLRRRAEPLTLHVDDGENLVGIRDRIREWRGEDPLRRDVQVTVVLENGRYELSSPLRLTELDSHVTWRAADGATVRISGGRRLANPHSVTDATILGHLPNGMSSKLVEYDLWGLGIREYGDYLYNYEYDISERMKIDGNNGETLTGSLKPPTSDSAGRLEAFAGDVPLRLSGTPTGEAYHISKVLQPSATKSTLSYVPDFIYREERPSNWANEPDPYVCGGWNEEWQEQFHRISRIDPATKEMVLDQPYYSRGYLQDADFRGLNLICELDEPGEYYLNRATGKLVVYPPNIPDSDVVEVSVAPRLIEANGADDVEFDGLVFECSRNSAFKFYGCRRCVVRNSTIRNVGQHVAIIEEGEACGFVNCEMKDMGGGGVWMADANASTLIPSGHFVERCHIHDFGRWHRMYRPAVYMSGVGMRVVGNDIHDCPHAAILHFGCDFTIADNEIHSVCRDSLDAGAVYTGRNWLLRGSVIRNNYFHDIIGKNGGWVRTVYLDDCFGAIRIEGNRFERCTWSIFIGGARENVVVDNVFEDCPRAIFFDARGCGWWRQGVDDRAYNLRLLRTHLNEPYISRYPELSTLLDGDFHYPENNVVENNRFIRGDAVYLKLFGLDKTENWWQALSIDGNLLPYFNAHNIIRNNEINNAAKQ